MGGHSKRSCYSPEIPIPVPPPQYDLIVSGVCLPDVTGNYVEDGLYNGKMSYKRTDGLFYIAWFNGIPAYLLSTEKGVDNDEGFSNTMDLESPFGIYNPQVFSEGNPVASQP